MAHSQLLIAIQFWSDVIDQRFDYLCTRLRRPAHRAEQNHRGDLAELVGASMG